MPIVYTYPLVQNPQESDLFVITHKDPETEEVSTRSISLGKLYALVGAGGINGTKGFIPVFNGSTSIVDSIIQQAEEADKITISGDLEVTGDVTFPGSVTLNGVIKDSTASTGGINTVLVSQGDGTVKWDRAPQAKNFTYTQAVPSRVWTINHNLDKKPSVSVVDSADTVVVGNVEYVDDNNLVITFENIFSGKAYLN